MNMRTMIQK